MRRDTDGEVLLDGIEHAAFGYFRQTVNPAVGISKLEGDIALVLPTELLKALFECCEAKLPFWVPGC